jgi:RNA polymerase sigma factor (sigma-70 family)
MDTKRSEQRRKRREEAAAAQDESRGGLDGVEAADTQAAVLRGMMRLPEDQREVLVLRLIDEKSYAEIATLTGRKVGTVGWLISVGMKALAAELAPLVGGAGDAERVEPVIGRVQSLQGGVS